MQSLIDFLRAEAIRPFQWGQSDCALFLADWWMARHGGPDPAAHLRGAYDDEEGCAAIVRAAGGLPKLVRSIALSVGAMPASEPVTGDFGVIRMRGRHHGAILSPRGRWIGRDEGGIAAVKDARMVAAWRID